MKISAAVPALSALAQETRLAIFRYLIKAGPEGAIVNEIRDQLDIPNATLSFHLNTLKQTGLVECRRNGRELIHTANYTFMRDLLTFLIEDCCAANKEICCTLPQLIRSKRC